MTAPLTSPPAATASPDPVDVAVIGAGQAGLAAGYFLAETQTEGFFQYGTDQARLRLANARENLERLLAGLHDAAPDHVVDERRVDAHELHRAEREQLGGAAPA